MIHIGRMSSSCFGSQVHRLLVHKLQFHTTVVYFQKGICITTIKKYQGTTKCQKCMWQSKQGHVFPLLSISKMHVTVQTGACISTLVYFQNACDSPNRGMYFHSCLFPKSKSYIIPSFKTNTIFRHCFSKGKGLPLTCQCRHAEGVHVHLYSCLIMVLDR